MLPVQRVEIANVTDTLLTWRRRLRYVHEALRQRAGTGSSLTTMQLLKCEYWMSRWSPSVHRLVCTGLAAQCGNSGGACDDSAQRPEQRQHSPSGRDDCNASCTVKAGTPCLPASQSRTGQAPGWQQCPALRNSFTVLRNCSSCYVQTHVHRLFCLMLFAVHVCHIRGSSRHAAGATGHDATGHWDCLAVDATDCSSAQHSCARAIECQQL
jgi:hypothetical protein